MHIVTEQPAPPSRLTKWLVRLYIPAMVLILTVGMGFALKFGYKQVPPIVMSPSFFDQPAEIGAVVFRRFYEPIREAPTVAFGIPLEPEFHRDILKGFLLAAEQSGFHFDQIIAEQQMPDLDLGGVTVTTVIKTATNSDTQSELVDAVTKAEAAGHHTLLYLPTVFSTHILTGNPLLRLEKAVGHSIFSFSTGALPLANDQEYLVDPACLGTERDSSGTSDLGCAILMAARPFYKDMIAKDHDQKENAKPKPDNQRRWVAIMNQSTPGDDYLLMVSSPGQHQGNAGENKKIRMNPPAGRGGQTR